jgi:hypothetical protein
LKATTRTGSLNCPDIRSAMTVSRSVRSTSVSRLDSAKDAKAVDYEVKISVPGSSAGD